MSCSSSSRCHAGNFGVGKNKECCIETEGLPGPAGLPGPTGATGATGPSVAIGQLGFFLQQDVINNTRTVVEFSSGGDLAGPQSSFTYVTASPGAGFLILEDGNYRLSYSINLSNVTLFGPSGPAGPRELTTYEAWYTINDGTLPILAAYSTTRGSVSLPVLGPPVPVVPESIVALRAEEVVPLLAGQLLQVVVNHDGNIGNLGVEAIYDPNTSPSQTEAGTFAQIERLVIM